MFSKDAAVLQGTIELLVLKRLSQGPMHGYGIAAPRRIIQCSVLSAQYQGYTALSRHFAREAGWTTGRTGYGLSPIIPVHSRRLNRAVGT